MSFFPDALASIGQQADATGVPPTIALPLPGIPPISFGGPGQLAGGPAAIGGPGQLAGGSAQLPGQNPVAQQTQQMAANPIYGQTSPFQPPMTNPNPNPNVGIGFGPAPIARSSGGTPAQIGLDQGGPAQLAGGPAPIDIGNIGFGKSMGGPGQLAGGPAGITFPGQNPLQGTPMAGPGQLAGGPAPAQGQLARIARPGLDQGGPQFAGGLRPAPRNYRPPLRRMR